VSAACGSVANAARHAVVLRVRVQSSGSHSSAPAAHLVVPVQLLSLRVDQTITRRHRPRSSRREPPSNRSRALFSSWATYFFCPLQSFPLSWLLLSPALRAPRRLARVSLWRSVCATRAASFCCLLSHRWMKVESVPRLHDEQAAATSAGSRNRARRTRSGSKCRRPAWSDSLYCVSWR